jgi:hypothetical protein
MKAYYDPYVRYIQVNWNSMLAERRKETEKRLAHDMQTLKAEGSALRTRKLDEE